MALYQILGYLESISSQLSILQHVVISLLALSLQTQYKWGSFFMSKLLAQSFLNIIPVKLLRTAHNALGIGEKMHIFKVFLGDLFAFTD